MFFFCDTSNSPEKRNALIRLPTEVKKKKFMLYIVSNSWFTSSTHCSMPPSWKKSKKNLLFTIFYKFNIRKLYSFFFFFYMYLKFQIFFLDPSTIHLVTEKRWTGKVALELGGLGTCFGSLEPVLLCGVFWSRVMTEVRFCHHCHDETSWPHI